VILLIGTLTFFTKTGPQFSREWVIWSFSITYFGFIFYRLFFRKLIKRLQKAGYNQKKVIIAGAGDLGQRACQAMQEESWAGLTPVAFFDDARQNESYFGLEVKGNLNDITSYIESQRSNDPIDQVWIALPLRAQKEIEKLQMSLQDTATKVFFIPDLFGFNLTSYEVNETVGLPVMNMSAPPLKGWSATLKRTEDIIISSLSLILLSPFFIIIAILIKLDSPGPVFFKQKRYGREGKEILVWKFRSMTVTENGNEVKQASRNDLRVTKIGAFLRKSSIDVLSKEGARLYG